MNHGTSFAFRGHFPWRVKGSNEIPKCAVNDCNPVFCRCSTFQDLDEGKSCTKSPTSSAKNYTENSIEPTQ